MRNNTKNNNTKNYNNKHTERIFLPVTAVPPLQVHVFVLHTVLAVNVHAETVCPASHVEQVPPHTL